MGPCEQRVVQLEAEVREQQLYIEQLHASQARQLENIPNLHLGPENQYRGGGGRPSTCLCLRVNM